VNAADEAQSQPNGVGFELGTMMYLPSSRPAEKGHGFFLAIEADVAPVVVGYCYERLDVYLTADDSNAGQSVDVHVDAQIHQMRVIKPVFDVIAVGLGFGIADLRGVIEANPNAAQVGTMFTDLAPVMDIFVRVGLLQGGRRMHSAVNLLFGYRFIVVKDVDPDGPPGAGLIGQSYQNDLNNLNGIRLGLSVNVTF
jgi:hypothetical protein